MIEHHFRQFLKKFYRGGPLLLALSGGPDSMALFYLFLNAQIPFSVAHVNHGWRAESQEEADKLEKLCQEKQIPFQYKILTLSGPNLEDRCRNERLAFFRSCLTPDMEGVALGHQADDWAETILKRIFEGARLTKLAGMKPLSQYEGMTLLRPLLKVRKRDIIEWLTAQEVWFFTDPTNADPRFLRSRLRHRILPFLQQEFGKSLDTSLIRLAEASLELDADLQQRLCAYPIQNTAQGISVDFSQTSQSSLFEWRMTLAHFFETQGVEISTLMLQHMVTHLQRKSCHKTLRLKNWYVTLDRRVLYLHPQ